jgi:UDP-2-acetamido-2,6-beta-L-arabino-hexul-4-ose reductase
MTYPLHENDAGSFQELAHAYDVEFGQLSLLTIAPGCKRGGHYHTHKKEWFCCIHGKCHLILIDISNKQRRTVVLTGDHRECVEVNPYKSHTVQNCSDQECELLVISSEEYDPDNPDTIKYTIK